MLLVRLINFTKNKFLKFYSTKELTSKNVTKYTETINLPKTKFPTRLKQEKREQIERNLVANSFVKLYDYQEKHKKDPTYVLHDGPPYANGNLHMGHAVNKILKDITLRKHVVNNQKIHYVPGWDCHGLPIELKAIKQNTNMSPIEIRTKSRKFAFTTLEMHSKEFESWGVMANWAKKKIYNTEDPNFIENQIKVFYKLFNEKLIYRDFKPVYWSPSSKTALAEAELEYDPNFISPSIYLRMKLKNIPKELSNYANVFGVIWTTTPWTIPSNQGICYNKNFEYSLVKFDNCNNEFYLIGTDLLKQFENVTKLNFKIVDKISGKSFEDCEYFHPIDGSILKFYSADHVDNMKGTGLVHTAPAHGLEDFLISLKHNIPLKCLIDGDGKYTSEAPEFLKTKSVMPDGNDLVKNYLKEDILFSDKLVHSYPVDWRTKEPVIVRASEQWFLNTSELKNKAIEEIDKIIFYPKAQSEINKKNLMAKILKRPFWCISRQKCWGIPIPVFYHKKTKNILINEALISHLIFLLKTHGNIDFWWTKEIKDLIPSEILSEWQLNENDIVKGEDIFDIWFDSGITWMNALENEKIANLYLEGYDQFTGWFQSSLLLSIAYRNCSPYKSLFVHGFAVDENGHKMSKSLGNIIEPKDVIKKYGTDVLRWFVASHGTQHSSIIVNDNLLQSSAETLSKIRTTLRYLNGFIDNGNNENIDSFNFHYLDKFLLHSLHNFDTEIKNLYFSFEYNRVTSTIQNIIANQISIYLHLIKDRLYCDDKNNFAIVKYVLKSCYKILCKALWPVLPFMTEESWSYYDKSSFYENNIQLPNEWINSEAIEIIDMVLNIKKKLNQNYKDINTWLLDCYIDSDSKNLQILKKVQQRVGCKISDSELCYLLQVASVTLNLENSCNIIEISCKPSENINLCPRCRRYLINDFENVCQRCNFVLKSKNISTIN